MSEYMEKHTVATLIGAPPGYVGFEEAGGAGQLITDINKQPFSILLLDEVEKAHPDVFNVLLQVLDEGEIKSRSGKKASFKNTIVIMTSNLGAQANEQNNMGFGTDLARSGEEDKAVKDFFKPEFRNRLDKVVKFKKLENNDVRKVVVKFINELKDSLKPKNIGLYVTEELVSHMAEIGYDPTMGARPIKRQIADLLKKPLSKRILFEGLRNCTVTADYVNDNIVFTDGEHALMPGRVMSEPTDPGHADDDGYIVLDELQPPDGDV